MQELIEFYEMVAWNDAVLTGNERNAILDARRALRAFARAMERFKAASTEAQSAEERRFDMAA